MSETGPQGVVSVLRKEYSDIAVWSQAHAAAVHSAKLKHAGLKPRDYLGCCQPYCVPHLLATGFLLILLAVERIRLLSSAAWRNGSMREKKSVPASMRHLALISGFKEAGMS